MPARGWFLGLECYCVLDLPSNLCESLLRLEDTKNRRQFQVGLSRLVSPLNTITTIHPEVLPRFYERWNVLVNGKIIYAGLIVRSGPQSHLL